MKSRRIAISIALLIGAGGAAVLPAGIPAASSRAFVPKPRTIVVTLLGGAQRTERGDLTLSFNTKGGVDGVILRDLTDRSTSLRLIDREHPAELACDPKDADYGSVQRRDGSWIAVAVCPEGESSGRIAIPALLRSRMSANEASATTVKCWENKELRMGVCYKVGTDPAAGPMPQTREHILLARQVGVPSL
jgi:hypothetical protein